MIHMILHALFGLVVGLVARWIFPAYAPGGLILTCVLGLAGAWLGGFLGRAMGMYKEGHPAGFFMALLGAIAILFGYHLIAR